MKLRRDYLAAHLELPDIDYCDAQTYGRAEHFKPTTDRLDFQLVEMDDGGWRRRLCRPYTCCESCAVTICLTPVPNPEVGTRRPVVRMFRRR